MVRLSVPALLIAGAASLIYFGADIAPRREPDCNAPSTVLSHLDEGSLTHEEIERRLQIHKYRIAVKDRAVRDLLDGRLTLLQSAARFRDLETENPLTWWPSNAATGPADGERLCRVVMDRANGWMQTNQPAQAADFAARLQVEFERHRGPDDAVRLPD